MITFIYKHRNAYGVKPICRVLPIAPSPYHERLAKWRDQLCNPLVSGGMKS